MKWERMQDLELPSVICEDELIKQAGKEITQFLDFGVMIRNLLKLGVKEIWGVKINNYYYINEKVQLVDSHGNELENQFRTITESLQIDTEFGTFSECEFYSKFKGEKNENIF